MSRESAGADNHSLEGTQDARGTRLLRLPGPFRMHRGGELPEVQIAYETWGELNTAGDNAVVIFTGLSPSAHATSSRANPEPGWWEFMVGHGKPIDTDRLFVICINSLGSCFGSTGPSSINPATGEPYRLDFPELAIEDIAHAGREVVRSLGVERLHALIGVSMGGMTALAYAVHYPDEFRHMVNICSAASATPHAIAVRSLQREMVRADPAWLGGHYPPYREPVEGMRLARKLGLISYRSAVEWEQRFERQRMPMERRGEVPFDPEFEIESYLEANARKFARTFDANSYLYLSRAMDWFDLGEHEERLIALRDSSRGKRALVLGVETDVLFPLHQQERLADLLGECGLHVGFEALPSVQGHDAFLVDRERFNPLIADFLQAIATD